MSLLLTTRAEPALELSGVDVSAAHEGSPPLLTGVDWVVAPRDFWVVGGLLNTGKTRLLETAAGMLAPQRGTVKLLGNEIRLGLAEEELHDRLKLGLVQDGGLMFRGLTVGENISLPLRYHHNVSQETAEPRLLRWLDEIGLKGKAGSTSGSIGRTWAQRAGLARACILEPEILLLDNPLTGLDLQHARWWLEILNQLWRGHPLVSHRPMTLVVTCDDFRPWICEGRSYARLHQGRFEILDPNRGDRHLNEMLMEETLPS